MHVHQLSRLAATSLLALCGGLLAQQATSLITGLPEDASRASGRLPAYSTANRKGQSPNWRYAIKPEYEAFRLRFRARSKDATPGPLDWQKARVDVRLTNEKNQDVAWVQRHDFINTRNWQFFDVLYPIPEKARFFAAFPALFGGKGEFEVADVDILAYNRTTYDALQRVPDDGNLLSTDRLRSISLPGASVTAEHTLRLAEGDTAATLYLPIPENLRQSQPRTPGFIATLTCRARALNVTRGEASWQIPFVQLAPADKLAMTDWNHPRKHILKTDQQDWQDVRLTIGITPETPFAVVTLAHHAPAGTLEFADLRLTIEREPANVPAPNGLSDAQNFSLQDAWATATPTRRKICLNGLWQFQPVFDKDSAATVRDSARGWGWFKVPASWPDLVKPWEPYAHTFTLPAWITTQVKENKNILHYAWYRRDIAIPADWNGKRCLVDFELFQGKGDVYIDGKRVAPVEFPGGPVDITAAVTPGKTHSLQVWISTEPRESSVFMGMTREYKDVTELRNKGICGDVFLCAVPMTHEIQDVLIITSVKNRTITFDTGFTRLPKGTYALNATVSRQGKAVKTFASKPFQADGSPEFRHTFAAQWTDPLLWDTDQPDNLYTLSLSLRDPNGNTLDTLYDETFGFREFELRGRDFYLNGTRIHLRALPINHTAHDAWSTRDVIDSLAKRAKKLNLNFFFDGDRSYNFRVGTNCYDRDFREVLSRHGILSSLALPHAVSDFQANLHDPKIADAYRKLCAYRIRRYQNLPGIVLYSANHNALGHADMQNPISMGTDWRPKGDANVKSRRYCGLMSEKIINDIDPTRAVYHHDAGNLGRISAQNFYLNWAPMQERSDWLEPWEKNGTMPIIFVEYGIPHIASWSSFRGPGFIWRVPGVQGTMVDEYNAETLGEKVYAHHERKARLFNAEYKRSQNNTPVRFFTGGMAIAVPSSDELRSIWLWNNLRDMRARGLSGFQPWDGSSLHRRIGNATVGEHPQRFVNLKQPGSVADIIRSGGSILTSPFDDFEPNLTGMAFERGCLPLLGWLSGKPDDFTERAIAYLPGEKVTKSLTILNDTRRNQTVQYAWTLAVGTDVKAQDRGSVTIQPGGRATVPVPFTMPDALNGTHPVLNATFTFADGSQPLQDTLQLQAITPKTPQLGNAAIGLWDPEQTAEPLLRKLGLTPRSVNAASDLNGLDLLVIGRFGLDSIPFDLENAIRSGLRVLVLEQNAERLNQLQLRYACQGLRDLFPLRQSDGQQLVHWRGSSTTRPYFPPGQEVNSSYPKSLWNGFLNTHIWYCGQRGNVADILPEKPTRGDWLPIYHGGYDLQYAPLMLFREHNAAIMLCQLNVSGRTETDPQALNTLADALTRLQCAPAAPRRNVLALGDKASQLLRQLAVSATPLTADAIRNADPDKTLIVLQGGAKLPNDALRLVKQGASLLALGLDKAEILALDPSANVTDGEFFTDLATGLDQFPEFAGLSNAELHLRYAEPFASFPADAPAGRLLHRARRGKGTIVFFQMPPFRLNQEEFIKRTTVRRTQFATSRLLANLGAHAATDFIAMFRKADDRQRSLTLPTVWDGIEDPQNQGRERGFFKPDFTPQNWRKVKVPGNFDEQFDALKDYEGYFWYRTTFDVSPYLASQPLVLDLGPIDDESWVWLDGNFLGELTKQTNPQNYWSAPRKFTIPANSLKPGTHTLAVLVNDIFMRGGILGTPKLTAPISFSLYADTPVDEDDPYRYFHW